MHCANVVSVLVWRVSGRETWYWFWAIKNVIQVLMKDGQNRVFVGICEDLETSDSTDVDNFEEISKLGSVTAFNCIW